MTGTPLSIRSFGAKEGYFHGLTQRVVSVSLTLSPSAGPDLTARLDVVLGKVLGPRSQDSSGADTTQNLAGQDFINSFGFWTLQILEDAGFPHIGPPQFVLRPQTEESAREYLLFIPTLAWRATALCARFLETLLGDLYKDPTRTTFLEEERVKFEALRNQLRAAAPKGTNNHKFISAAHALNIPCIPLQGQVFQYGWGSRAHWMSSSVSDETPMLAVRTARNKFAAGQMLYQAGFPIPDFELVRTEEAASTAAERIGYPVVVKPADQDGGVGVSVWLKTPEQVSEAFARARKLSPNVLVQKFMTMPEHRLNLFRGRLIGANQRLPAGVTGDGQTSILSLIEQANTHPERIPQKRDGVAPLCLNDEARELLAFQGFTAETVPPEGVFVRLSHEARRRSGGMSSSVFDRVHPDNVAIAAEAAALLRLDIAGVDFFCEDISKSWKDSPAVITEINSAPQYGMLSKKLPEIVLHDLVRGEGRIPVILCLDMSAAAMMQLARGLEEALDQKGVHLGVTIPGHLRDATGWSQHDRVSALRGARTLVMRPTIDAALIGIDFAEIKKNGLPLDRFDALVVNDPNLSGTIHPNDIGAEEGVSSKADLAFLGGIRLHLRGPAFLGANHPYLPQIRAALKNTPIRRVESVQALAEALIGICVEHSQSGTT